MNCNRIFRPTNLLPIACTAMSATLTVPVLAQVCNPGLVSNIGSPGVNSQVRALTVMPNGDVVAGGSFTLAGGNSAPNKVARYSSATGQWTAPTAGTNGSTVYALAALPDGDLLVGGNFGPIGGISVNRFGRYDPDTDTWFNLGFGNNGGAVYAILPIPGGDIIIGGSFSRVAGVNANHVGRYTPSTGVWTPMGSQFVSSGDEVNALALAPDGTVIVAGVFLNGPGIGALRIARYHPTTNSWSTLSTGVNNTVDAVVVLPDGDVIAGGYFTVAGGVTVSRLARYNPGSNTWSDMGGGTSGSFNYVNALALLPNGDVVASGSFTVVSGVPATRIARYNPATNTWFSLGISPNQDVAALAVTQTGDIVLGGFFTNTGARISQYSFGGTLPTIIEDPQSISEACDDGVAEFTVVATGTTPLAYQWRKDGTPIDVSENLSAVTSTLMFSPPVAADDGVYDCIVTSTCGSVTSAPATLTVVSCDYCPADFNDDGGIDGSDVADFYVAWENADPTADTNQDGGVDGSDVDAFFIAWENGGC